MPEKNLYLDDLYVGQTFVSGEHALDEAQIIAYARQFDPQVFHLDPEAAKHTFFQGLAASGWHTASIMHAPGDREHSAGGRRDRRRHGRAGVAAAHTAR